PAFQCGWRGSGVTGRDLLGRVDPLAAGPLRRNGLLYRSGPMDASMDPVGGGDIPYGDEWLVPWFHQLVVVAGAVLGAPDPGLPRGLQRLSLQGSWRRAGAHQAPERQRGSEVRRPDA